MTVIFENARVRVLEANLAPGEKSEPVELRDAVVVPLSDYEIRFIAADGTSQTGERKTGVPVWAPVSPPVSEVSNKPADAIVVEIKCSGLGELLKTGDR